VQQGLPNHLSVIDASSVGGRGSPFGCAAHHEATLRDDNVAFLQVGLFRETSAMPETIVIDHVVEATTLAEVTRPSTSERSLARPAMNDVTPIKRVKSGGRPTFHFISQARPPRNDFMRPSSTSSTSAMHSPGIRNDLRRCRSQSAADSFHRTCGVRVLRRHVAAEGDRDAKALRRLSPVAMGTPTCRPRCSRSAIPGRLGSAALMIRSSG
jgi:hypothetical protein